MAKRIIKNQQGFTLIEVMIAMAIFAVYVTAIVLTQSTNLNDSARLSEDLNLHNLAELKMNEMLISDIKFTNATENDPETGNFEVDGYEKYKFEVKFKKFVLPDYDAISGKSDEDAQNDESKQNALQKIVFEKMKVNIEKMIWQISVTVTNSESKEAYELISWIENKNAKVDTNFAL